MATKKPQDHMPKQLPVKDVPGGREVTVEGLKITIREAAFRDHRVVQKLAKLRKGDIPIEEKIILNGEMIDRVLGDAQADALIDALADDNGYTDITVLAAKFNEIVGAAFPNS